MKYNCCETIQSGQVMFKRRCVVVDDLCFTCVTFCTNLVSCILRLNKNTSLYPFLLCFITRVICYDQLALQFLLIYWFFTNAWKKLTLLSLINLFLLNYRKRDWKKLPSTSAAIWCTLLELQACPKASCCLMTISPSLQR